jgi:hypothetical protein
MGVPWTNGDEINKSESYFLESWYINRGEEKKTRRVFVICWVHIILFFKKKKIQTFSICFCHKKILIKNKKTHVCD